AATGETDGCAMPRQVPGSSRGERRRTSLLLPPLRSVAPLARRPYWESPRSVRHGSKKHWEAAALTNAGQGWRLRAVPQRDEATTSWSRPRDPGSAPDHRMATGVMAST